MKDVLSYKVAGEGSDQFTMAVNEARRWMRDLPENAKVKFSLNLQTGDYALTKAQDDAAEKKDTTGDLFAGKEAPASPPDVEIGPRKVAPPQIEDQRIDVQCPTCGGTGEIFDAQDSLRRTCPTCEGAKWIKMGTQPENSDDGDDAEAAASDG